MICILSIFESEVVVNKRDSKQKGNYAYHYSIRFRLVESDMVWAHNGWALTTTLLLKIKKNINRNYVYAIVLVLALVVLVHY